MVRELILTGKFKKSLKLAKKRGLNISVLDEVVTMLQNDISLDMRYCDHELKGRFAGFRECHIQPDWLLVECPSKNGVSFNCQEKCGNNIDKSIDLFFEKMLFCWYTERVIFR